MIVQFVTDMRDVTLSAHIKFTSWIFDDIISHVNVVTFKHFPLQIFPRLKIKKLQNVHWYHNGS